LPGPARQLARDMAEDVVLGVAREHFNAAASLRGPELEAARRCLAVLPWCSDAVAAERRLLDAAALVVDVGADMVPLQLRLKVE
ncbi:unnamed protein product, partial [Phaeothamnion confervicola]